MAGPQNTYFSFISHDDRLGRTTCHIFHAGSQACQAFRFPRQRPFANFVYKSSMHERQIFINSLFIQSYEICSTVGKAFQIAAEEIKSRNENPFSALPGEARERLFTIKRVWSGRPLLVYRGRGRPVPPADSPHRSQARGGHWSWAGHKTTNVYFSTF